MDVVDVPLRPLAQTFAIVRADKLARGIDDIPQRVGPRELCRGDPGHQGQIHVVRLEPVVFVCIYAT